MSRRITVVRKAGPRFGWGASLEEQVIDLSAKLVELEALIHAISEDMAGVRRVLLLDPSPR